MQSVTNKRSALIGAIVDKKEGNEAYTENGALTNASTLNKVLDLFFQAGAMRSRPDSDIRDMVDAAAQQNLELTCKLIFWARDVTKGAGERRFFRVAFARLVETNPDELAGLVKLIPQYGRWDDLEILLNTALESRMLQVMKEYGFEAQDALFAKWLPQRGELVNKLTKVMGLTGKPKEFRKMRVALNNVIETKMCQKDFESINYSHVPSQAMRKYRKAFAKQDADRFKKYIESLVKGDKEVKVNAKAVFPYQILEAIIKESNSDQISLLDQQWKALPNFMEANGKRVLPVCDVSGSMSGGGLTPLPINVCVSLGIYTAERNVGPFKDAFITFSGTPQLQLLKGKNLKERAKNLDNADWGMSTDVNKVFKLILSTGRANKVPADEMPNVILIMSDMEFNVASRGRTPFDEIKADYAQYGYEMPKVVFWNLAARNKDNFPVIDTTPNTALVSGFSPSILKPLLAGEIPRPDMVMLEVLEADRYAPVTVN